MRTNPDMARRAVMICLALLTCRGARADEAISVSAARSEVSQSEAPGIFVHDVVSPFQRGTTQIRVLLPEPLEGSRRYPVIYLLPVEAGREHRYGDGLLEVQRTGLQRQVAAIFVAPTFSQLPWYADHPTDSAVRQESHFLQAVVPTVDKLYPTQGERSGRLLLGFSKSGWGAWSLLLRHPEVFERAAAWDAPLEMREVGHYGSGPIFGTPENFERYRIVDLLARQAPVLRDGARLVLMGWGGFRDDMQAAHTRLEGLRVPHYFGDGPQRTHDWHSGWVREAVEQLLDVDQPRSGAG